MGNIGMGLGLRPHIGYWDGNWAKEFRHWVLGLVLGKVVLGQHWSERGYDVRDRTARSAQVWQFRSFCFIVLFSFLVFQPTAWIPSVYAL